MPSRLEAVLRAGEAHRASLQTGALQMENMSDDELRLILDMIGRGGVDDACRNAAKWCALNKRHRAMCQESGDALWTELTRRIFGSYPPALDNSGSAQKKFYALCARVYACRELHKDLSDLMDQLDTYEDEEEDTEAQTGHATVVRADLWVPVLAQIRDKFAQLARLRPSRSSESHMSYIRATRMFLLAVRFGMRWNTYENDLNHAPPPPHSAGVGLLERYPYILNFEHTLSAFTNALEPAMVAAERTETQPDIIKITANALEQFGRDSVLSSFHPTERWFAEDAVRLYVNRVDEHAEEGGNEWVEADVPVFEFAL
jgi:hypothetical protein